MDCKKIGELIRRLRKERDMTQKQLADQMNLSDKAISKWERGMGCPDISLVEELSDILGINIYQLLSGELLENEFVGGNMKNTKFYVCPVCGNITMCTGSAEVFCCGRSLVVLEEKKACEEEKLKVTPVEDEWCIESGHPMKKEDYISFLAFATGDRLQILKQYPEWEMHVRVPKCGHGKLIWYSTTKGLFYQFI